MINLVSLLSHTWVKMLFVTLLIIQLKKASAKHFNKELVITKKYNEDFKNSNKWFARKFMLRVTLKWEVLHIVIVVSKLK